MNPPTLSVVIPTYKRADVLRRAIRSVMSQGDNFVELIVADDASPDHTTEMLASLALEEPRLKHVRRAVNGGTAATRNSGAAEAAGEWITFLDDDDEMLPGFLAEMRRTLAAAPPSAGFAWCGVRWVMDANSQEGTFLQDGFWKPEFPSRQAAYLGFLRDRKIGTNCGLTIRRSAFRELGGFDESLRAAVDTDFLVRVAQHFDFVVVPEIFINVHLHGNGHVRRDMRAHAEAYVRIAEKHEAALRQNPALAASLFNKAGWLHYHSGNRAAGRKHMLKALRHKPRSIKTWMMLAGFELLGPRAAKLHEWAWARRTGSQRRVPGTPDGLPHTAP